MHTEHLQNVRPVIVLTGWLVAVAVTSIVVFVFIVLGLMGDQASRDTLWALMAVVAGFMVGGWFVGFRVLEAPILHGIGVGLTSLLVWAVLNLLVVIPFGIDEWTGLSAASTVLVVTSQILAAVAGCWVGTRGARARAELAATPDAGARGRGED